GPLRWRVLPLLVVCVAALLLSFCDVPPAAAALCGALLGLVMIPAALFVSRKKGWAAYCTTVCPLGLLACLLGRLSFWRVRTTSRCTSCGACTRVCRYGALDAARLAAGGPGLSCTLCRDCLNVCPHGGLSLRWLGMGAGGGAEKAFVALVAAMHALFLFSAMV
ncbi:4Fe-4S dicluster domain-containing protein, partial [uncultured Mailhella sp.]|uniref:4Fe-4S binding protein n=1 Tax=uncultured Mailhella sp. TaxID=1981031 RepID=UPI0026007CC3